MTKDEVIAQCFHNILLVTETPMSKKHLAEAVRYHVHGAQRELRILEAEARDAR